MKHNSLEEKLIGLFEFIKATQPMKWENLHHETRKSKGTFF
jgi:hypothetical protein